MNLNSIDQGKMARHAAPVEAQAPSLHLAHSAKPVVLRDKFIDLEAVCALVGFKKSTVYTWMKDPESGLPLPVRFGRRVRWSEAAILQFIQGRIQASATESGVQA